MENVNYFLEIGTELLATNSVQNMLIDGTVLRRLIYFIYLLAGPFQSSIDRSECVEQNITFSKICLWKMSNCLCFNNESWNMVISPNMFHPPQKKWIFFFPLKEFIFFVTKTYLSHNGVIFFLCAKVSWPIPEQSVLIFNMKASFWGLFRT